MRVVVGVIMIFIMLVTITIIVLVVVMVQLPSWSIESVVTTSLLLGVHRPCSQGCAHFGGPLWVFTVPACRAVFTLKVVQ